jgi:hypothetical protein
MANYPPQLSNFRLIVSKIILAGILMALPLGCQQPSDAPLPQEVIDPSISVEEAKAWFEENLAASNTSNARTTKSSKKTPLWDLAKESKFKKGHPIIVIPMAYEGEESKLTAALDGTDNPAPEPWESEHTLIRKLIVFKNKKAEKQAVVMYVIPTKY